MRRTKEKRSLVDEIRAFSAAAPQPAADHRRRWTAEMDEAFAKNHNEGKPVAVCARAAQAAAPPGVVVTLAAATHRVASLKFTGAIR